LPNWRTHWEELYTLGVAMNLTPGQINELSRFEFVCMANGFRRIHRREPDKPPAMDDETLAELGIEGF
jgi:hypothetical protein